MRLNWFLSNYHKKANSLLWSVTIEIGIHLKWPNQTSDDEKHILILNLIAMNVCRADVAVAYYVCYASGDRNALEMAEPQFLKVRNTFLVQLSGFDATALSWMLCIDHGHTRSYDLGMGELPNGTCQAQNGKTHLCLRAPDNLPLGLSFPHLIVGCVSKQQELPQVGLRRLCSGMFNC
jgi:hypothetical protein